MNLVIEAMSKKVAEEILDWKYEQPYDFYNNERTDESMQEMLDGSYYALFDEHKALVGFFCIGKSAQVPSGNHVYTNGFIDMGLGMNPERVGKRHGQEFCSFVLMYIKEKYKDIPIRLTVAKFNQRAIHLYEKLGFVRKDEFKAGSTDFIVMVKKCLNDF